MPDAGNNSAFALYPKPAAPQNNGLLSGDPQHVIGTINALQGLAARNAIGEIYRRNIRPDGTLDEHGAIRDLGSSPAAGYLAPEAVGGMLTREGQRISNTTALFEQQAKQNQFVVNGLGTLADKPNLSLEDVRNFAVTAARNTGIPSDMLSAWMAQLPRDPKKLREALVSLRNMATGSPALSEPTQTGILPGGAPVTGSRGQFNYQTAPGGGAPPSPQNNPPGVQTGLSPSESAAAGVTGHGAGEALATARNQSIAFPNQVFPLEQAIDELERLGTKGTGPGSDTLNHIKSFALTMGVPGVNADEVATYDKAKKYLTDFVNQTGNSSTNDKLAAAFAGNPSVNISNAAAKDVAKAALALRRSQEARTKAFEDAGLADTDFAKFAGKWNRQHDVRVFGWDLMTPEQRKKVLAPMTQNQRDLFMLDVQDAANGGIIRGPRLLPPQAGKK